MKNLLMLAVVCLAAPAWADSNTIRLGVLTDIGSNNSDSAGMGSVEAARMAAEDAAGVLGARKVEVLFGDHLGKPDIGAGIVRSWLDRDGVDAIVDVPQSAVALAVMPLVQKADKVALFSGAGDGAISGKACNANTVQWTYSTYALAHSTGTALAADGGKSWFFISADYTFGQTLEHDTTEAVSAAGGKVLGAVHAPFNTPDFSSYLVTAASSGAQVVALANVAADTRNSIIQANEFGLTKNGTRLAAMLLDVNDVRAIGLKVAQGLYATNPFYWDRTEASRAWSQRFMARTGRMPSIIQAGVYSAVSAYLKAVVATGSVAGSVVVPQMRATPVADTFAEHGTLRADGLMVHEMYLMRVKTPAASKGPWDLFEVVKTIPAEAAFPSLAASECPLVRK